MDPTVTEAGLPGRVLCWEIGSSKCRRRVRAQGSGHMERGSECMKGKVDERVSKRVS